MLEIILFYEDKAPDNFGRHLNNILTQDDKWLESCHNYIQWLFPNREPSFFNSEAPILTNDIIKEFKSRPDLLFNVKRSLDRMIKFYHLDIDEKHPWWVTKNNHNFLRITRILHTLKELEMQDELMDFVSKLYFICINNEEIIGESSVFWQNAFDGKKDYEI